MVDVSDGARFSLNRGRGLIVLLPHRDDHKRKHDCEDGTDRSDDRTRDIVVGQLGILRDIITNSDKAGGCNSTHAGDNDNRKQPWRNRVDPSHTEGFAREVLPPVANATPAVSTRL